MSDNIQTEAQIPKASLVNLFRCSEALDYFLFSVGLVLAFIQGVGLPFFSIFWGNLADSLTNSSDTIDQARGVLLKFFYLGIGEFLAGWGSYACLMITGFRQSIQCRKLYLQKLLRQEIAWFDARNQEQMSIKFSIDCLTYQRAIGENFFHLTMIIGMTVSGTVIAFIYGWLMTLVIYAALPFLGYAYYLFGKASASKSKIEEQAFTEVGGKTEEIFSSIQTVKMLNGQDYQMSKFSTILDRAKEKVASFIKWMAFYLALTNMFLILTLTLGYWFGTKCVTGSEGCLTSYSEGTSYSAGNAIIIVFILIFPAVNLAQLVFSFEKIAEGKQAAARIFEVIDRAPLIQSSPNAIVPDQFKGVFRFQNVSFAYPTSSQKVLDGLTLEIAAKSTAIVGESGCGKSTIFQLMMRFYDPSEGRVTLDGVDLKEINLEWLRKQIGYVGQEPVLFAMSVRENLLLANPTATEEEIIAALMEAEAYDFVRQMKDGLDSFVGNAGDLISGGQKQRIAIARALVKKPQILLLDQATSSLDLVNQALIQDTLSKISENIKTVTIAHRKATIKSCKQIYRLKNGNTCLHLKQTDLQQQTVENDLFLAQNVSKISKKRTSSQYHNEREVEKINPQTDVRLTEQDMQHLEAPTQGFMQIFYQLLKGYKIYMLLAIAISIANGTSYPVFGIILSKIFYVWIQFDPKSPQPTFSEVNKYTLFGIIVAVVGGLLIALDKYSFNTIGLEVSSNIRRNALNKIIRMPLVWFQDKEHTSGRLSVIINEDCDTINKFTSSLLMSVFLLLSGITFGLVLAFLYEWRTALVSVGLLPLIGLSSFLQLSSSAGLKSEIQQQLELSANIINQSVKNIRTVASLTAEELLQQKYDEKVSISQQTIVKKSIVSGVFFGLSYIMMYVVCGLMLFLGINFKVQNNLSSGDFLSAIYLVIFSGLNTGAAILYFPDVSAAKLSLRRVYKLLSLKEERDEDSSKKGKTPEVRGSIVFDHVFFKYEGSSFSVLNDVSFEIKAGEKVGVVGHSGCGKSTIVKLIQGFYRPTSGTIRIDGVDLADFNVQHLRQSIGVVNQQPVLFNDNVLSNIIYNRSGEGKDVLKLVQESSFTPLTQLSTDRDSDDWLQTEVGFKGSHLSGGQKQRIAVLRALYRQPSVFLLDQATSALDETNEKMVLSALAKSASNKTVINVTHRLGCLQTFDNILVFKNGALVQVGKFDDLMRKKQDFHRLYKGQKHSRISRSKSLRFKD